MSLLRPRFLIPLVLVTLATLFDAISTIIALHTGQAHEGDPLVAWGLTRAGDIYLFLPLIGSLVLIAFGLWLAVRHNWRVLATCIVVVMWWATIAHTQAAISNLAVIHSLGV